jgi:hypothetical protein
VIEDQPIAVESQPVPVEEQPVEAESSLVVVSDSSPAEPAAPSSNEELDKTA